VDIHLGVDRAEGIFVIEEKSKLKRESGPERETGTMDVVRSMCQSQEDSMLEGSVELVPGAAEEEEEEEEEQTAAGENMAAAAVGACSGETELVKRRDSDQEVLDVRRRSRSKPLSASATRTRTARSSGFPLWMPPVSGMHTAILASSSTYPESTKRRHMSS